MSINSIKSYSLSTKVFTGNAVFDIANLLDSRARQLVSIEADARTSADAAIDSKFTAAVAEINAELARVTVLAETLGNAELGQVEDSLLKVLSQPDFQGLLSGGVLEGYKLQSLVQSLLNRPEEAQDIIQAYVNDVPSVVTKVMTDGRQGTFSATLVPIEADAAAGTPERLMYRYVCADFLGAPAIQEVTFNVSRFPGSDKLWLQEQAVGYILVDFRSDYVAGQAAQVLVPDLNGDAVIGINVPVGNGATGG